MTNDNKRFRAPPLIITKGMLDAGVKLFEFMAADPQNHTDQALVGGVFTEMWRVYWDEVQAVGRRKSAGSPIVEIEPKSRLILPRRIVAAVNSHNTQDGTPSPRQISTYKPSGTDESDGVLTIKSEDGTVEMKKLLRPVSLNDLADTLVEPDPPDE